ncbi:MAG: SIMPL domain-containing protein [archaeon]|nr:MAG: SIMPL domain-containing protein [archaeon]
MAKPARPGVAGATVVLLIAVAVLATSTGFMSYLYLQKTTERTGPIQIGDGSVTFPPSSGPYSSQSGNFDPTYTISVSGSAQIQYTPNEALVGISVVAKNATALGATKEDAILTAKVIKALNSIGIANTSMHTQGFSLYPNYYECYCYNPNPPAIVSYTVSNSLTINITNSDPAALGLKAGQVIDTATGAGANQVNLDFSGTRSMVQKLQNQVLSWAVDSAHQQATLIATEAGVNITGVVSASSGYSSYCCYSDYAPRGIQDASAYLTPIIPGTQTLYSSVQVVYSID